MSIKLQPQQLSIAERLLNQTKTLLQMQKDYFRLSGKAKHDRKLYTEANALKTQCQQFENALISELEELEKGEVS